MSDKDGVNIQSSNQNLKASDGPAPSGTLSSYFRSQDTSKDQGQQQQIIQPRPDSPVTLFGSEFALGCGESRTTWDQHSITSRFTHGETTESVYSITTSNSTETTSEEEDEGRSQSSHMQDLLGGDIDVDRVAPSLGDLDLAMTFLSAEKVKLAVSHFDGHSMSHELGNDIRSDPSLGYFDSAIQFLAAERAKSTALHIDGHNTNQSSTHEGVEHSTIHPKHKRRRQRKAPPVTPGNMENYGKTLAGARVVNALLTPEGSSDSPDLSPAEKNGRRPTLSTSNPRLLKIQYLMLSQSQQRLYIPSSAPTHIRCPLPIPPDPRLLRLLTLTKKLRDHFPQNKSHLARILVPEFNENGLLDTQGPAPRIEDALTYIFIDHSNIISGLLKYVNGSWRHPLGRPIMSFPALALILERGRPISRRVLATSSPLYQTMDTAENLGYHMHVHVRVPGFSADTVNRTNTNPQTRMDESPKPVVNTINFKARKSTQVAHADDNLAAHTHSSSSSNLGQQSPPLPSPCLRLPQELPHSYPHYMFPTTVSAYYSSALTPAETNEMALDTNRYREHGVDELLQLKVHQVLASPDSDPPLAGATIVLATGDGPNGQFDEGRFLGLVRIALSKGWVVELYVWGASISSAWRKVAQHEGKGVLHVWELDPFLNDLLEVDAIGPADDQQQTSYSSRQTLANIPCSDDAECFAAIRSPGSPSSATPNVTVDLPGKTFHFTTSRRESPISSDQSLPNQNSRPGAARATGQASIRSRSDSPYLLDPEVSRSPLTQATVGIKPDVFIDISGKTADFTSGDIETPNSSNASTPSSKFNIEAVSNLSGRIKIIKGPLCAGGFCDIYQGELTNERGTELVAMKMLRVFNTEAHVVKAKKKFRREVRLWCLLRHPYVLPFHGTCDFDEFRLFMISPWAEGGNSLEYLRRNPFADRGLLLWQTSSALEYLHSGKEAPQTVHGDIKADNVLVSATGDALLCDFGLSRYVEEIISKSGSSSAGRAGGHARFMAPELLLSPKGPTNISKPTTESDVFAFASLMLQIYTEQPPFGDLGEVQAILKVAHGEMPPRPVEPIILERGLTDHTWAVMSECWRSSPSMRPTMRDVSRRMSIL